MTIPDFFESDRTTVEAALQELMPPEDALPISIHKAMRYSVFAGGKRIRPILCMEAARMFSAEQSRRSADRLRAGIYSHLFVDSR